ncbi:hypothetical protein ABK040_001751 [Willaertia magna]
MNQDPTTVPLEGPPTLDNQINTPPVIPSGFFLFIIILIIILQCVVQLWKKYHRKSYLMTSFTLMWLFPALFIIFVGGLLNYKRMLIIWTIYSIVTCYIGYLSLRKALSPNTPKKVYVWFYSVHKLSHFITIAGTCLFCLELFFGLYTIIISKLLFDLEIFKFLFPSPDILIFYGLYFGVLVRDCGDLCTEAISSTLEADRNKFYLSPSQLNRICGICNQELKYESKLEIDPESNIYSNDNNEEGEISTTDKQPLFNRSIIDEGDVSNNTSSKKKRKTIQETKVLTCGHKFHEFCIRGWFIVGKKQTCPICKEIANPKELDLLQKNFPWNSDSEFYISVLDLTRYFVVWNPLIILFIQLILSLTYGLNK